MSVSHVIDTETRNDSEECDVEWLNPVVEATERAWQSLFAPHTLMAAQFVPTVWRDPGERQGRRFVG
jgi:hypothetical protein